MPLPGRILPPAPGTFRALRHRDFRLLWLGQLVSLTGGWMQSLAQGWLVLRLTDSAFFLGLVGFFSYLPVLVLALPAGVVADRLPRRRALMWVQASAMVLALVLALLTWLDLVKPWHVAALAFGTGIVGALDIPIRQSFLLDLVGREDLPNAIALNSLAFNSARFIGPFAGGLLLARFGEATVFFLNALSFTAVLSGIGLMRATASRPPAAGADWIAEIRMGTAHVAADARMRTLLAMVVVTSVFCMPYSILLPVFARDILAVGSSGLGVLMAAAGAGAVAGALFLATRREGSLAGRTAVLAMGVLGAALFAFSASRDMRLSVPLLFLVGAAMIVQMATSNTMLQLLSPPELRGRIISLYMLAFMGMAPFGSLLAGSLARGLGAPAAVGLGGAICLGSALGFGLRLPQAHTAKPVLREGQP